MTEGLQENQSTKTPLPYAQIAVWVVVVLLFGALMPLGIATVWAPRCGSCHDTVVDDIVMNAHKDIECESCHLTGSWVDKTSDRAKVMYQMVLRVGTIDSTVASYVPNRTCIGCHEDSDKAGLISANGVRIDHTSCVTGIECTLCHANVGHRAETALSIGYTMDSCLRCHSQQSVSGAAGCEMCHDGSSAKTKRHQATAFSVTHGANWEQTHGMGDLTTCRSCHPENDCARCHGPGVPHPGGFIGTHGPSARPADNKCGTCHKDESFCSNCHGLEMPHPETFISEHSATSNKVGRSVCDNCHVSSDCIECHTAHIHPGGAQLP